MREYDDQGREEPTMLEFALFVALIVAGVTVWAYAVVGFWAVNERWLRAVWELVHG